MRNVPHEVTLIAFKGSEIVDIVETSRHFAYGFIRRFRKLDHADGLLVTKPNVPVLGLRPMVKL